jgi:hypothetical protein
MHSDAGDTTQLVPGYPIRTPWDHSSVDSSPRPIAASHVLHRLLVPRHPPHALTNLTTKMLASTVQFSTNNPTTPTPQHPPPQQETVCQEGQQENPRKPTPHAGLFPQDPTGCSNTTTSNPTTRSTPTTRQAVLEPQGHQTVTQPASPPTSKPPRNPRPRRPP